MCTFGMTQSDAQGEALIKKMTGFMTNSPEIAKQLNSKCSGDHRHIQLFNGRAAKAQVYPDKLCQKIISGLINQMKADGRLNEGEIGATTPMEINAAEIIEQYWDDMSGELLDTQLVKMARNEEMIEVRKHKLYDKVPIQECWEMTGKAPIGVRWVDVNKGDRIHPEYRSRIVAKEIKTDKREDLFAATPPLEANKLLMSMAVTEGIGYRRNDRANGMKLDFIDVRRAYFHANARRTVYVQLPDEDYEEGMCARLNKAMYGTRDAAQNWEYEYCEFMESIGMKRGIASPCVFFNKERNLRAVVHGDDFTMLGQEGQLDWFRRMISERYEVKFRGRIGPASNCLLYTSPSPRD